MVLAPPSNWVGPLLPEFPELVLLEPTVAGKLEVGAGAVGKTKVPFEVPFEVPTEEGHPVPAALQTGAVPVGLTGTWMEC